MAEATETAPAAPPADSPSSIFGAAKERAKAATHQGGAFLEAAEKQAIWEKGNPFWIVDVRVYESKDYGSRVDFVLNMDPANSDAKFGEYTPDNTRTFGSSGNPFRDALAEEILALLPQHGSIGPLYLHKLPSTKGNPSWDFSDVPRDGTVPY